ncbi:hypothetical protein OG963_00985 [Streptomyces sp. NBC_01707]|uniref:hypothetical protein n=1 Tax=unclassified Streptomyces TaxID=2593676 RepID=UPI002E0F6B13|nr:hypothetical protein OG763_00720 [Streptomyces sp. NBC_01230]
MVSLAINEPVAKVRESALNQISEAFNHHHLPLNLGEPLAEVMTTMEPELLAHTLYILGATHDAQASPLIEPFLNHLDRDVREEAGLAAAEITTSTSEVRNHNNAHFRGWIAGSVCAQGGPGRPAADAARYKSGSPGWHGFSSPPTRST